MSSAILFNLENSYILVFNFGKETNSISDEDNRLVKFKAFANAKSNDQAFGLFLIG